jgi:hypothetical protein
MSVSRAGSIGQKQIISSPPPRQREGRHSVARGSSFSDFRQDLAVGV